MGTEPKMERGRDNERNIKHVTENYTMLQNAIQNKVMLEHFIKVKRHGM